MALATQAGLPHRLAGFPHRASNIEHRAAPAQAGLNSTPVSVILPIFNEEASLPGAAREILAVAPVFFADYELILVNDGSDDRTASICGELAAESPCVRAIHHSSNRGYGAALRSGFAAATKEWIFFMDADRQFRFDDISGLLPHLERHDLIMGYRAPRHDPWFRILAARIGNFLARWMLGIRARDINCAFKLVRRDRLQALDLRSEGGFINAELLALAAAEGWRCVEAPVRHFPRRYGAATGARPRVIGRILWECLRLRRRILSKAR
ncbi:MAG: glycosyltransferase family 2 protein [Verrucomicrobiae bacterium]|nr:glycosyltransferase family 2 protein [Verrucomicrobiae bacterium]